MAELCQDGLSSKQLKLIASTLDQSAGPCHVFPVGQDMLAVPGKGYFNPHCKQGKAPMINRILEGP